MRVVVAFASLVFVVGLSACPEPEDGGLGTPLPQAWTALCDGLDDGACLDDGPLQCVEGGPPRAACEACGCAGGDACVATTGDGVCASRVVREAVRDADVVSDGLDDATYLALWDLLDDATGSRLTLVEWRDSLARQAETDGRQRVVVVGREGGDRGDLVIAALREVGATDLAPAGATCADRAAAAAALEVPTIFGPVDLVVDLGAVDDAHSALCALPGSVPSCVLPHRASCLARGGLLPQTVVVVDDDVFLARLDDALVRSVARVGRATWEQRLDSVVATFSARVLQQRSEPRFVVGDDEIRLVEVPVVDATVDPSLGSLFIAWLPRFDTLPARSISFRALWRDGPTRVFLTDHDIVPADCAFDVGLTGVVEVVCVGSDGAVVEATVDAARAAIVDVTRTAS